MMEENLNNPNIEWYKKRTANVLMHAIVWIIALSLPYLLDTHHGISHRSESCDQNFRYLNFTTNILWILPFYLNAYLLTPRFFYRRRYTLHVGLLILVFGVMLAVHSLLFIYAFQLPHFNLRRSIRFTLPPFLLIIATSTAFRMVGDKIRADSKQQEQQKENLKTELSFLRSQINPHFIFNILNNLVALDQLKSPELSPTILKLAALMQYMLYDTDEDRVPLSKETNYLQSYIDLQRQRFGKKVSITVSLDTADNFFEIEPMLLIPFVENAFKHGVGMIENPVIDVALTVENNILRFYVRNRYNASSVETKDKGSGIGLSNVKRRLELLYGTNQSLDITQENEWFSILLTLNLH